MSHLGRNRGRHYERRRRREERKERQGRAARQQIRKVGGPKSENAFWQDLTATGGDVEVDEEGGREGVQ